MMLSHPVARTAFRTQDVASLNESHHASSIREFWTAFSTALGLFLVTTTSYAPAKAQVQGDTAFVALSEPGAFITYCLPATLRLTVETIDPERRIDQVEFFADSTSLGFVSEPPYALIRTNIAAPLIGSNGGYLNFYAIAADKFGRSFTTKVHRVGFLAGPCQPQLTLESRQKVYFPVGWGSGILLGPTNVLTLLVPVYNLDNNINPVQVFMGTNLLATVPQAAPFLTLTNLPVGRHTFSTRIEDLSGRGHIGNSLSATVMHLSINRIGPLRNGQISFQASGALPGVPVDVYSSTGFTDWKVFERLTPDAENFTFSYPAPTSNQPLFFRLGISTRSLYPVR